MPRSPSASWPRQRLSRSVTSVRAGHGFRGEQPEIDQRPRPDNERASVEDEGEACRRPVREGGAIKHLAAVECYVVEIAARVRDEGGGGRGRYGQIPNGTGRPQGQERRVQDSSRFGPPYASEGHAIGHGVTRCESVRPLRQHQDVAGHGCVQGRRQPPHRYCHPCSCYWVCHVDYTASSEEQL